MVKMIDVVHGRADVLPTPFPMEVQTCWLRSTLHFAPAACTIRCKPDGTPLPSLLYQGLPPSASQALSSCSTSRCRWISAKQASARQARTNIPMLRRRRSWLQTVSPRHRYDTSVRGVPYTRFPVSQKPYTGSSRIRNPVYGVRPYDPE